VDQRLQVVILLLRLRFGRAASRTTPESSISAKIPMPITKIAAPPPQLPAAAQFTTAKSP
jgi:hypothetical protein